MVPNDRIVGGRPTLPLFSCKRAFFRHRACLLSLSAAVMNALYDVGRLQLIPYSAYWILCTSLVTLSTSFLFGSPSFVLSLLMLSFLVMRNSFFITKSFTAVLPESAAMYAFVGTGLCHLGIERNKYLYAYAAIKCLIPGLCPVNVSVKGGKLQGVPRNEGTGMIAFLIQDRNFAEWKGGDL